HVQDRGDVRWGDDDGVRFPFGPGVGAEVPLFHPPRVKGPLSFPGAVLSRERHVHTASSAETGPEGPVQISENPAAAAGLGRPNHTSDGEVGQPDRGVGDGGIGGWWVGYRLSAIGGWW